MKNYVKQFIRSRYELIVNEARVMDALKVLHRYNPNSKPKVKNCGWDDAKDVWYIDFTASGKQMDSIKSELRDSKFKGVILIENVNSWVKVVNFT